MGEGKIVCFQDKMLHPTVIVVRFGQDEAGKRLYYCKHITDAVDKETGFLKTRHYVFHTNRPVQGIKAAYDMLFSGEVTFCENISAEDIENSLNADLIGIDELSKRRPPKPSYTCTQGGQDDWYKERPYQKQKVQRTTQQQQHHPRTAKKCSFFDTVTEEIADDFHNLKKEARILGKKIFNFFCEGGAARTGVERESDRRATNGRSTDKRNK